MFFQNKSKYCTSIFLDLSTFHLFNHFIQGTLKHHSQSFSVSSKVFIIFGLIISIGQNFGASGCLLFRNECTIKILFIIPYCVQLIKFTLN